MYFEESTMYIQRDIFYIKSHDFHSLENHNVFMRIYFTAFENNKFLFCTEQTNYEILQVA